MQGSGLSSATGNAVQTGRRALGGGIEQVHELLKFARMEMTRAFVPPENGVPTGAMRPPRMREMCRSCCRSPTGSAACSKKLSSCGMLLQQTFPCYTSGDHEALRGAAAREALARTCVK